jgi:hypothetical protein
MKALLWTAIVLLTSTFAQGQPPSAERQSSGSGGQSIQGCLMQSGDTFVLNASGTQYRVLGGDKSQLKALTGHTVAVTGQMSGDEITLKSAQDVSSTCETNTSTTNSTSSSTSSEDATKKKPNTEEPKEKPPMSEQPPITPPPHAQLMPPVETAASAAAAAANAEAASASKPVYSESRYDEQAPPEKQTDADRMPQASTALPVLGIVGFGMLAAGLWDRVR